MPTASPTPARLALLVAVAVLTAIPASLAVAQEPMPVDHPEIRGSLAMRLGEAADAFRTGEPVWILADAEFPHVVREVYLRPEDLPHEVPDSLVLAGPFVTPRDFGSMRGIIPICMHMKRPYSMYVCAGAREDFYFPPLAPDEIESMTLTVRTRDGEVYPLPIPVGDVDAIFFSVSAFDRFAAPYYTRSYGVDYTKWLRDSIMKDAVDRVR